MGRTGAIAQLAERLHGMQEVGGSNPPGSTDKTPGQDTEAPPEMGGVLSVWGPGRSKVGLGTLWRVLAGVGIFSR